MQPEVSPKQPGETVTLGGRYRLLAQLGKGGMGSVYRAVDRLTRQHVALKRVYTEAGQQQIDLTTPASRLGSTTDPRFALAQEFQALATLHHPHIIGVRDYGFDSEGQPYFTMDLLENAQTILEAGRNQLQATQISLLVQILQALVYLHRRRLVHRDLKPGNVLVAGGRLKVLDFGLSVDVEQAVGTVGTLAYMTPEVIYGKSAGPASDLYAVGVLAYQLFTGRHPFDTNDSISSLLSHILNTTPDFTSVELEPPIVAILERLLAKDPAGRYADAGEVIEALGAAIGHPFPIETPETRESFLQAAPLVGRDTELAQLRDALVQTIVYGEGSSWLIAGESGVGKSRLVDELRTLAMVRGLRVVRSQATRSGGSPYLLWHDVIRRLTLLTKLQDEEAAVLKMIVPDVAGLIERDIPDAPAMDPQTVQARLTSVIKQVISRQREPFLIILEDLHWAGEESLALLDALTRLAPKAPLLLVGNYSDDETPHLPRLLPEAKMLKLERLSPAAIAQLSKSMLGEGGTHRNILSLLQQETEGNPFFLVEIVRALAEEAGQLGQVATMTLPKDIFTGGLQRLIKRRLNRVPPVYQPLLQVAATAGRLLDLNVLQTVKLHQNGSTAGFKLEDWLTACANAAVLEVQDDRWRFSHDKLRVGLLANLPTDRQRDLHRRVALAIEAAYSDVTGQATSLAYHWSRVGDSAKEAYYADVAGDQALRLGAYAEAKRYFEQAVAAVSRLPATGDNRRQLVDTTLKLSRVAAFRPTENIPLLLEQALDAAGALKDEARLASVFGSIGAFHYVGGRMAKAFDYFTRCMALAEKLNLERLLVLPYNLLGRALCGLGEFTQAADMLARGIALAEKFDDPEILAGSLAFYAASLCYQGKRAESEPYAQRALALAEELGYPSRIAGNLMALGFYHALCGYFEAAIDYLQRCLAVAAETQELHPLYTAHGCLGYVHLQLVQLNEAAYHLGDCLRLAETTEQLTTYLPMYQGFHAELVLHSGDHERALAEAEAALLLAERTQQLVARAFVQQSLSKILQAGSRPDWARAEQLLKESLALFEQRHGRPLVAVVTLELARLYAAQAMAEQARSALASALPEFENLGMVWHWQQARQLAATLQKGRKDR